MRRVRFFTPYHYELPRDAPLYAGLFLRVEKSEDGKVKLYVMQPDRSKTYASVTQLSEYFPVDHDVWHFLRSHGIQRRSRGGIKLHGARRLEVRLTFRALERLDSLVKKTGRSRSDLITEAILDWKP